MENKNMKAVVAYGPGDNRYEDFPVPHAGEGEIVLKVKGCGICAGVCPCGIWKMQVNTTAA